MSEAFNGIKVPRRIVVPAPPTPKPQGYVVSEADMRKIRAKLALIAGGYRANGLNMVTAQEIIGILQRGAIKFV